VIFDVVLIHCLTRIFLPHFGQQSQNVETNKGRRFVNPEHSVEYLDEQHTSGGLQITHSQNSLSLTVIGETLDCNSSALNSETTPCPLHVGHNTFFGCLISSKKSPTLHCKTKAIISSESMEKARRPVSQCDTTAAENPAFFANSSCVIFIAVRRSRI
jgi:hypothetical protein